MRKTKLEKGITLVALIITIVVLLILAVVSIGAVRNSGIIGHATNTSDAWKQAQKEENTYLQEYESYVASSGATAGVPIPAGFEYVEGTKDTGLVITDGNSEFVWIPVKTTLPEASVEAKVVTGNGSEYDAASDNLVKAGMPADSTSKQFLAQLKAEYDAMKESVEHYGGFYVGRYEVSNNGGKAQSVKGAISAKASDSISSTTSTWYGLYKLCKTYKTSSVTSSMIWGSQWDAMVKFIGSDSKSTGGNASRETGNVETDKIKNIYDLIGNSFEWTLEAYYNSHRVHRGGCCDSYGSPKSRGFYYADSGNDYAGSRLALYVEL